MPFSASRSSARRAWAPLLASLCLLATCDLQDPIAPARDEARLRAGSQAQLSTGADAASTPLGSATFASPSVDAGQSDHIPWLRTGIVLPDSSWVSIRVTGGVDLAPHPRAHYYPGCENNPDCFPWAGQRLGPNGRNAFFQTHTGFTYVATGRALTRSFVPLARGEEETDYLLFVTQGALEVWFRRNQGPRLTCPGLTNCVGPAPDYKAYVPTYEAPGGYTVSATRIPNPLRLEVTRTPTASDSSAALVINVQDGYRLIDVGGTAARITWSFLRGDTAEVPGSATGQVDTLSSCSGQTSCTVPIRESGRVRVVTQVEGNSATAYSAVIRTPDPAELVLACTPAVVTRGERVSCTASTEPAGVKLEQLSWIFEADGDDFAVMGPDTSRWEGPMVVSGTVTLHALVEGEAKEQSTRVEVRGREWAPITVSRVEERVEIRTDKKMRPYPYAGHNFAVLDLLKPDLMAPAVVPVASGPNTGLRYFLAPLELAGARVSVHPGLDAPAAPAASTPPARWYLDQNNLGNRCDAAGVARFRDKVARYEGIGAAEDSHVGVVNRTSRELELHLALERLYTTGDEMELRFQMAQLWNRFYAEASKRQQAFDTVSWIGMYDLGCTLDFDLNDH